MNGSSRPVSEWRIVFSLAALYVFRMLGLFMVFPVMMLYGMEYEEATPLLLGLALGCYGMTQAVFQIPLGLLSDVWGRKPIIVCGLILFAAGSIMAAMATDVWGLIIGRAIQGSGAIAGAVLALVGDLTSEQNRTRAMALIGVSIGVSFSVAMVIGPALAAWGGLATVFWLSGLLALVGIAIVYGLVPTPPQLKSSEHKPMPQMVRQVMSNVDLLRLDFGVFALHFVLTAAFVAVPVALAGEGVDVTSHWRYYLPIMVGSFIAMLPFIYLGERKRRLKAVFVGAVAVLACAELIMSVAGELWHWVAGLFVFFIAFNLLEATLPSLVSKQAPAGSKGTAMGIYSTCQFLGAATGGATGGLVYSAYGLSGVFVMGSLVCMIWVAAALGMRSPRYLQTITAPCAHAISEKALRESVPGVVEAQWVEPLANLYLKVDGELFKHENLQDFLRAAGVASAADPADFLPHTG